MKTLSFCAFAAVLLSTLAPGQTNEKRDGNAEPRDILLIDHIHGHWLTIGRINHKEPGGEFDPSVSYIRLKAGIIPIVKHYKTKDGDVYQIMFSSELAQKGDGIP